MKQFGNPFFSKRNPPPLSTNPLFLSNFFITSLFVQISKTRTPLPTPTCLNILCGGLGGGEGKVLYFKKWGIALKYCWNHGLSKLLFCFVKYRLDQPSNKKTKIVLNSTKQFFDSYYWKQCLVKVWSISTHPQQNDRPFKIFAKLHGNYVLLANMFKLYKCQTFGLMKKDNLSKISSANNKFIFLTISLWKYLVYN